MPEGLLWLLLTGNIPNQVEFDSISNDLKERSGIPEDLKNHIKN